jgi:3,4-dihydroxy-2-butanone 4-phosphate synthase
LVGFFHVDIAEVRTAEGKVCLYVAIDRTARFAFLPMVKKTGWTSASAFLEALSHAVPYKIYTAERLSDNGIQYCGRVGRRDFTASLSQNGA